MNKLVLIRSLLSMALCLLAGGRTAAQSVWNLSVSDSPAGNVNPNTQITYVINITNLTGATLNTTVTDTFPASATFISATNNLGATTSNTSGQVVVFLPGFSTVPLQITIVLAPTASGSFTNFVTVGSPILTNTISTNLVTQVNALTTTLNATVTLPTAAVLSNDWITYNVTVNNPGSNSASSVVLSSTLPAGAILISPKTPAPDSNGVMLFNIGTLASKASDTFAITIQPANTGTNYFVESLSSSRSSTVTTTNSLVVAPFDTTQLQVTAASNTNYYPQIGLIEQTIQVANISTNPITGIRVVVTNLPTNLSYNVAFQAVGTNYGNPFVENDVTTLQPNQSVTFALEYARALINVSNLQFTAVPVTPPTISVPSGTGLNISNWVRLPGVFMIEFPASKGATYAVIYADNATMSNALPAQPPIVAPANAVEWIDFGPPETISPPTNRFYQVIRTQ